GRAVLPRRSADDHRRRHQRDTATRHRARPARALRLGLVSEPNRIRRSAPIFGVRDVDAALAYYERLGFAVRKYEGGGYGFANRDAVELHLGFAAEWARSSAYMWVDDSDALAAEWRAAGAEVHGPEDTAWGQHEGALVDLDGNVIRFGTPIPPA